MKGLKETLVMVCLVLSIAILSTVWLVLVLDHPVSDGSGAIIEEGGPVGLLEPQPVAPDDEDVPDGTPDHWVEHIVWEDDAKADFEWGSRPLGPWQGRDQVGSVDNGPPGQPDDSDDEGTDPPTDEDEPEPVSEDLEFLSELEGLQNFSMSTDPYTSGWGPCSPGDSAVYSTDGSIERTIEEADIVKVEDDTFYLLNAYRGLMAYNMDDPDQPYLMGSVPVLGDPIDMYIVEDKAYILVRTSINYWYRYSMMGMWWGTAGSRYQIGSHLVIVDLTVPYAMTIVREYPIEGFVVDSRRVGDVIYYVSVCYKWYNSYTTTQMDDMTYVMSVNIEDPWRVHPVEAVTFEGRSNEIHVTTEFLYVSHWRSVRGMRYGRTNITNVDISDPRGRIHVLDEFSVEGRVEDRYQMDHYEGTFRVVSHFRNPRESKLWTFSVEDPANVEPLGQLLIDDAGNLMATRFAGLRGYTIHLPRSIDPLDVLDLSDPSHPILCDVFEMPGWVTHMEVRGYKILAIGVDDSDGERNVAVSIFDVTDPWNVVMEDRVRIGGTRASSSANWDPKALTVLDDQGIVLVPFYSRGYDPDGTYHRRFGVQVVAFDLEEGDLEMGRFFEQPDNVLRTRSLGDRVVSTSNYFMVVADVTDIMDPRVTATVELSPLVIDYRIIDGRTFELIRQYSNNAGSYSWALRSFERWDPRFQYPFTEVELPWGIERWFWDGACLHVVSNSYDEDRNWNTTVTTYHLTGEEGVKTSSTTFPVGTDIPPWEFDHRGSYRYNRWLYGYAMGWRIDQGVDNPVMLEGGNIAMFYMEHLFIVKTDGDAGPQLMNVIDIEDESIFGILPNGPNLYLVGYYYHDVRYTDKYTTSMTMYTLLPVRLEPVLILADPEITAFPIDDPGILPKSQFKVVGKPAIGRVFDVPGFPLGVSEDGTMIYTISRWFTYGEGCNKKGLNIVSLNSGTPTIVRSIDVWSKGFKITGDTAIITDTFTDVKKEEGVTVVSGHRTKVFIVDLREPWSFDELEVENWYSLVYTGSGIVILRGYRSYTFAVIDLQGADDMKIQLFDVRPWGTTVFRDGPTVYLVQGRYGVNPIHLGS